MQFNLKAACLAAGMLIGGSGVALAQDAAFNGYYTMGAPPPVVYGPPMVAPDQYAIVGSSGIGFNGTNHPTPESTQGDVGPAGNNNGTLTGISRWR